MAAGVIVNGYRFLCVSLLKIDVQGVQAGRGWTEDEGNKSAPDERYIPELMCDSYKKGRPLDLHSPLQVHQSLTF